MSINYTIREIMWADPGPTDDRGGATPSTRHFPKIILIFWSCNAGRIRY